MRRSLTFAFLAVGLLTGACHDARRINPVDPDLTPAVTDVSTISSQSEGAIFVEWDQYSGRMPFDHYLVLRRLQGRVAEDTVAAIDDATVTRVADREIVPDVDYEYRVAIVNEAGYAALSESQPVRSFRVTATQLTGTATDAQSGRIQLAWSAYTGAGFEDYQILRRTFGSEATLLATVEDAATTSWIDTTALPSTNYTYQLRTHVLGESLDSNPRDVSYDLSPPALETVTADSDCACIRLQWTPYQGPRFGQYEIIRSVEGLTEVAIAAIILQDSTTYTDRHLDGNTTYSYRIRVQTTWDEVTTVSDAGAGIFHAWQEEQELPPISDAEVQGLAIAIDEGDRLWAVSTLISSTSARNMRNFLRVHFPAGTRTATNISNATIGTPDRLSPIRCVAREDHLYVVFYNDTADRVVVAVSVDGSAAWTTSIGAGIPVDLYFVEDQLVVLDEFGSGTLLDPATGEIIGEFAGLTSSLRRSEAFPIRDSVFAPGFFNNLDTWFLLAPQKTGNMSIGRFRVSPLIVGGSTEVFDDGIGPDPGQLLNPLVLDFEPERSRLHVMESRGLIQILDASDPSRLKTRGITRWGVFGRGPGEFFTTPTTAVGIAVDSQGFIHVADAATPGGRVQTFAP